MMPSLSYYLQRLVLSAYRLTARCSLPRDSALDVLLKQHLIVESHHQEESQYGEGGYRLDILVAGSNREEVQEESWRSLHVTCRAYFFLIRNKPMTAPEALSANPYTVSVYRIKWRPLSEYYAVLLNASLLTTISSQHQLIFNSTRDFSLTYFLPHISNHGRL